MKSRTYTFAEKLGLVAGYLGCLCFTSLILFFGVCCGGREPMGPSGFQLDPDLLSLIGARIAAYSAIALGVIIVANLIATSRQKRYRPPSVSNPSQRAPFTAFWIALFVIGYTSNALYAVAAFALSFLILRRTAWGSVPSAAQDEPDPELTREFDELGLAVIGEATPLYDTVGEGVLDGVKTRLTRSDLLWEQGDKPYYLYTVQVESRIDDLQLVIRKAHSETKPPKGLSAVTSSSSTLLNDVAVLSDDSGAASQLIANDIQAIKALMDWGEFLSLNAEPERYAGDEFFKGVGRLTLVQDSTKPETNPDLRGILNRLTALSENFNSRRTGEPSTE